MRRMRLISVLVAGGVMLSTALTVTASSAEAPAGSAIPGRYIVQLRPSIAVGDAANAIASRYGGDVGHLYRHALRGFSFSIDDRGAAAVAQDPRVLLVEPDQVMRAIATQTSPPWGLDRIDQRARPLNGQYVYNATGAGVTAYVIDTGIRFTHAQFGGRATSGRDTVNNDNDASDCHGHGTHVAGTVGGSTYGVAKQVSLVGVRVLDCGGSGATSGVIAGVDWVTGNHTSGPAVANMSLGGGANSSLDTAVRNSIADGISYAIAAGNGNIIGQAVDACTQSPARAAEAITVSATNSSDAKASWANYGTCVDIFAPGVGIVSSYYSSDTATATMDGTSMASPHVAGVAALYLQGSPGASPAAVATALTTNATTGVVTSPGSGTPNRLLYMGFIGGGGPPGNAAPTANFTSSCTGLTCSFTDTSTDSDGTIASRSWNFGDGGTSTATNPSHTYAAGGTYTVTLTVTDNAGATGSTSKTVSPSGGGGDPDPGTPTLTSGVARSDTNGAAGSWKYYKIQVPAGRPSLQVVLDGQACGLLSCNPDLDLFVRRGSKPTTTLRDCAGEGSTADETCSISSPAADWWYIGVYVYSGSSAKAYTIRATY